MLMLAPFQFVSAYGINGSQQVTRLPSEGPTNTSIEMAVCRTIVYTLNLSTQYRRARRAMNLISANNGSSVLPLWESSEQPLTLDATSICCFS